MHQNKIPSLRSSGIYKWTSLSECHHTKCATERTPQVPVSEGTITGRGDGWKGRELQLLLCGACSSCCPCQASSRWPDSQGVLWVLRQLLPWLQGGQPSVALTIKCVESCTVPIAAFGAGDCSKICLASICGAAETGTTDGGAAAACVDDCTVNRNSSTTIHGTRLQYAKPHLSHSSWPK
ncbi:hypothetical protein GQ55_4G044000 [Panicum hallii var. hallii]|uniref:Uncharacterized protein n=1 Tax=Panicum hallii var. hallii TaxID=1504633 RepID=A0A2T7DV50_9POAL|nr:hypothetical protein GQ55_4G044000 [Panicum hallii var. hallii]